MTIENLARDDVLSLRGYEAAEQAPETIRLNANEAPFTHDAGDPALNRYPEVRPVTLQKRLADLFGVPAANLLVTRGSSEAIDVLVRAFCRAYRDTFVTTPPTFGMYRFYADVQGVAIIEVPLARERDFAFDADALLDACTPTTKLVFLCSPNNPTGGRIARADIAKIAEARRGSSIVVVDEAYVEFATEPSLAGEVADFENLVVLRTLSKAHALAGARCGAAIASEAIISVLRRVLPPYSFATPVVASVMAALGHDRVRRSAQSVAEIVAERERLFTGLQSSPRVIRTWPSEANFLLTEFDDLAVVREMLRRRRILVRDYRDEPLLENCARITIGTAAENDALLDALRDPERPA